MAKIVGQLVFDIDLKSIKTDILIDKGFSKVKNKITNIFAKGTNNVIGTMTWTYTDSTLNEYSNINGNYVFYLPEGTISCFLGSRYLSNKRPSDYTLPINGGTGNFLNSIGTVMTKINSDLTESVIITFYDRIVYPLG
jgi:hypothetical protein